MLLIQECKECKKESNRTWWEWDEGGKKVFIVIVGLPMGGVASVCRPTIWAGPSPSRKSLNWLSGPRRVVGKTNLRVRGNSILMYGCCIWIDGRTAGWKLTFHRSCLSWCCHQLSPCCPALSLGSSSPQQCQSPCSVGWCSEASSSRRLKTTEVTAPAISALISAG